MTRRGWKALLVLVGLVLVVGLVLLAAGQFGAGTGVLATGLATVGAVVRRLEAGAERIRAILCPVSHPDNFRPDPADPGRILVDRGTPESPVSVALPPGIEASRVKAVEVLSPTKAAVEVIPW